jgi:hypothetical protein
MTNDIVQRLHKLHEVTGLSAILEAADLIEAQAKEIERLRSVLEDFSVHEDPDVKYPARSALGVKP